MFVPVRFVHRTDPLQVHGKRRIPIVQRRRIADAGIHRRQIATPRLDRHDASHSEGGRARHQLPRLLPDVELHRQRVTRLRAKLARGPGVQHDRFVRRLNARGDRRDVEGRHQRIRDLAIADAHAVGKIGEDRHRMATDALQCPGG